MDLIIPFFLKRGGGGGGGVPDAIVMTVNLVQLVSLCTNRTINIQIVCSPKCFIFLMFNRLGRKCRLKTHKIRHSIV